MFRCNKYNHHDIDINERNCLNLLDTFRNYFEKRLENQSSGGIHTQVRLTEGLVFLITLHVLINSFF